MKKIISFIFIQFIILYSCNSNNEKTNFKISSIESLKPIRINYDNIKPLNLTDIFKSISYIHLETSDDNMIGVIKKIIFSKNRIFIYDNNNKIFIFNKNGKLVNIIYENGRGPGEYVAFKDLVLNKYNNEIIIFEPVLFKFLYYDINGNFLREKRFEQYISKFFITENFYLFYSDNSSNIGNTIKVNDNLIITTKNLKYYSSFFPISKSKAGFASYGIQPFSEFDNKLSFLMPYTDTVFFISPDSVTPRFYFDFGKHKTPYDIFESVKSNTSIHERMKATINKINNFIKQGYAFEPRSFMETGYCIFFNFTYYTFKYAFYSKRSSQLFITDKFINDIDHTPYSAPVAATDSGFISILEPADLIEHYKKIKDKYPAKELRTIKQLVDSITEFDNPILVFAKTKPF